MVKYVVPNTDRQSRTNLNLRLELAAPGGNAPGAGMSADAIATEADEVEYVEYLETDYLDDDQEIVTVNEDEVEYIEAEQVDLEGHTVFEHEGKQYVIPSALQQSGEAILLQDCSTGGEPHFVFQDDQDDDGTETEAAEDIEEEPACDDTDEELEQHPEVTGRNLITGQTISLSGFLEKLRRKGSLPEVKREPVDESPYPASVKKQRRTYYGSPRYEIGPRGAHYELLPTHNRRVLVGQTPDGRNIVGRILQVSLFL